MSYSPTVPALSRPTNSISPGEADDEALAGTPLQSGRKIALVFSATDERPEAALAALAHCGITTIARVLDDAAGALVTAVKPVMTVVLWDAGSPAAASRIAAMLPREDAGLLLMIDCGTSVAGTIAAFELGADASLNLEADARLVAATIHALLRRTAQEIPAPVPAAPLQASVGGLVLDRDTFEVYEGGELLRLTPTEFRILAHLAAHSDETQTHSQIMAVLHDYQFTKLEAQQSVKVYIRRLRTKLAACATPSVQIVNSRSLGYRLQPVRLELAGRAAVRG